MARNIDNSETKELIGFYQMGLDSIIQGNYSITCYDGKDPSWADNEYHPTTEYIIEIDYGNSLCRADRYRLDSNRCVFLFKGLD